MKTRTIFLVDSIGAATTFLFLWLFYTVHNCLGMNHSSAIYLMIYAAVLSFLSAIIFLSNPRKIGLFLQLIAILNIAYIVFTIEFITFNTAKLTIFGYVYFAVECLIISSLAYLEFQRSKFIDR